MGNIPGFKGERLAPDHHALTKLYRRDATPFLSARADAVVRLVGLGRVGAVVAQSLAPAGIGTLLLDDDVKVSAVDVGPGPYKLTDIGMSRAVAVRRSLSQTTPGFRGHVVRPMGTNRGDFRAVDLTIVSGSGPIPAATVATLMSDDLPHLLATTQGTIGRVGPLVVPGQGACADCVQAQLPPAVALTAEEDPVDSATKQPPGEPEVSLALRVAGAVVDSALIYLDGARRAAAQSALLTLTLGRATQRVQRFLPDPGCGCQLQFTAFDEINGPSVSQIR